jgi:hypothetical protein
LEGNIVSNKGQEARRVIETVLEEQENEFRQMNEELASFFSDDECDEGFWDDMENDVADLLVQRTGQSIEGSCYDDYI